MGLLPAWAAPLHRPWTTTLRAPLQTFLGANFPVPASRAAACWTRRAGGIPSHHREAGGREAAVDTRQCCYRASGQLRAKQRRPWRAAERVPPATKFPEQRLAEARAPGCLPRYPTLG